VIGYPSRQDGVILPAWDMGGIWCFIPCNKSFIDQACLVKMVAWILAFVTVYKHTKKELCLYLAILTSCLVNNQYINMAPIFVYVNISLSLHVSYVVHQAGGNPSFFSMKQLGVFLLPSGWDASPLQGYIQH